MKNEKFNHNRIFNCFKRFVCFFTCFILCICLIPSNLVFAENQAFTINSVTSFSKSDIATQGTSLYYNNLAYFAGYSGESEVYCFIYAGRARFVSASSFSAGGVVENNSSWQVERFNGSNIYSEDYPLYLSTWNRDNPSPNTSIPVFDTIEDGVIFYWNYINGATPSYDIPFSLNYELPAGNVIYIKTQNQDDVIALNTTFFTNSKLFSSTWSNITQCYQQNVSDLPSAGVQFPLSGMGTIPWIKSSDTNILGQTKSASFSFQSGSYDTWAVIYNPLYQNFAQPPQGDFNGSIHINAENCLDYYTYPLSGYLTSYSDNGMVSSSVSDYTDHYTVSRDENGDPIIDSNGNPVEVNQNGDLGDPSFGGTNQTPESTNIIDYVKELGNILSNFTNNFLSLIQVPLSHIGQLIQSGTGFMSALRGMYAWLPVDIQGLVIAALSVVIGIGVFKVFL